MRDQATVFQVGELFVVSPKSDDLHHPLLLKNLINEAMLNVDPSGIRIASPRFPDICIGSWDSEARSTIRCPSIEKPGNDDLPGY